MADFSSSDGEVSSDENEQESRIERVEKPDIRAPPADSSDDESSDGDLSDDGPPTRPNVQPPTQPDSDGDLSDDEPPPPIATPKDNVQAKPHQQDPDSDGELSDDEPPPSRPNDNNIKTHDPDIENVSDESGRENVSSDEDEKPKKDEALENVSDDDADNFDLTDVPVTKPSKIDTAAPIIESRPSVSGTGLDDHGELDYDDAELHPPNVLQQSESGITLSDSHSSQQMREGAGREEEVGVDKVKVQDDGPEDVSSDEDGMLDNDGPQKKVEPAGSEDGEVVESCDGSEDGEIAGDDDWGRGDYPSNTTCRFFMRGFCNWGDNCKFLHPAPGSGGGVPIGSQGIQLKDLRRRYEVNPTNNDISVEREVTPPPAEPAAPAAPKVETAWERGLRQAKELMKKSKQRKETEPNLEEKRMNLSIEEPVKPVIEKDPYYDQESDVDMYGDDDFAVDNLTLAEARQSWRGGHYENFEIRYTREPDTYSPPRRGRGDDHYGELLRGADRHAGRNLHGDDDIRRSARSPEMSGKQRRPDEWTDPWIRSKDKEKGGKRGSVSPGRPRGRRRFRRRSYSSSGSSSYSGSSSGSSSRSSSRSSSASSRSSYGGRGRQLPYPKRRRDRQPVTQPQVKRGDYFTSRAPIPQSSRVPSRGSGRPLDIPRRPADGPFSRQRMSPPGGARGRQTEQSRTAAPARGRDKSAPAPPTPKSPPRHAARDKPRTDKSKPPEPKPHTTEKPRKTSESTTKPAERTDRHRKPTESTQKRTEHRSSTSKPTETSSRHSSRQVQPSKAEFKAAKAATEKADAAKLAAKASSSRAPPPARSDRTSKPAARPDRTRPAADRSRPQQRPVATKRKRGGSSSGSDSSLSSVSSSSSSSDDDDVPTRHKSPRQPTRPAKPAPKSPVSAAKTSSSSARPSKSAPPSKAPPPKQARPESRSDKQRPPATSTRPHGRDDSRRPLDKGSSKPVAHTKPIQHVKPLPKEPDSPRRDEPHRHGGSQHSSKTRPDSSKSATSPTKPAPSGIKLTLMKKTGDKMSAVKRPAVPDSGPASKRSKEDTSEKSSKLKPVQPASKPAAPKKTESAKPEKKKSAGSRREELLKQLKAVEDAISRKRSKLT